MIKERFKVGQKVVYPSHGVGKIIEIAKQKISDLEIDLYVIYFLSDKMTLHVPIARANHVGLRALTEKSKIEEVYVSLREDPKKGNKMWSRREADYRSKITSGELVAIAEVVRDLYKNINSDRSYSERTIYELSLSRLAQEIAMLEDISLDTSKERIVDILKEKTISTVTA